MNSKRRRVIKLLAKRLPESKRLIIQGESIQGCDIDGDIVAKSNISVKPELYYNVNKPKWKDLDHEKALKKAYNRNGNQGIIDYVKWVDFNNRRLNKLFAELKLQQVDNELLNVIKKGAKGLWRNLILFFYAFLKIFAKRD